MNEQNFDRLFKDKLAGHLQSPPGELASKLEAKLDQHRRSAWIQFARVAAAFTLIAASVYLLNILNSQPSNQIATHNVVPVTPIPPVKEKPVKTPDEEDRNMILNELTVAPAATSIADLPLENLVVSNTPKPQKPENIEPPVPEETEVTNEIHTDKPERPKITITYKRSAKKSEPQNEPMPALQPQTEKKSRQRKKIWRRAKMVDYTLAGIRATKDQLLAINRKDKNKGTKPN